MELLSFEKERGKSMHQFDSTFVMTRILQSDEPVNIAAVYLTPGDVIGYHRASTSQLVLLMSGEGTVRDEQHMRPIKAGQAVFWAQQEWHEMATEVGMMALVIEGELLSTTHFLTTL